MSSKLDYATLAPQYWNSGIDVTPVPHGERRAVLPGWNKLGIPNEAKREQLTKRYRDHGIGVVLGGIIAKDRILVAIDVDFPNESFVDAVRVVLGDGVIVTKFGQKGLTYFVLAFAALQSEHLDNSNGVRAIDILGPGTMTIIPGTIH